MDKKELGKKLYKLYYNFENTLCQSYKIASPDLLRTSYELRKLHDDLMDEVDD